MHATATRRESVDSGSAEVMNDITEVLDINLKADDVGLETLSQLSHKAMQFLDEAAYLLN